MTMKIKKEKIAKTRCIYAQEPTNIRRKHTRVYTRVHTTPHNYLGQFAQQCKLVFHFLFIFAISAPVFSRLSFFEIGNSLLQIL